MGVASIVRKNPERRVGRRAHSRVRCELRADIKAGGASEWLPAQVHDVSTAGFKLMLPPEPFPRDSLWLRLPGFEPLAAKVAWRKGGLAGCQFLYPVAGELQARLEALVGAAMGERRRDPPPAPAPVSTRG